ncbi:MAG TPA: hypothetical protein PK156_35580, partial [Polyangium sp.]|nr:hypothetical protein [Polyangium sp.]
MGLKFLRPLRAVAVVGAVSVVFSACQEPTQITLEIRTDLDCSVEPNTAIVVGARGTESSTPGTVTDMCMDGRIGAIVLLPRSAKNEGISVRIVTGIGAGYTAEKCLAQPELQDDFTKGVLEGCIIARRTLNFIPHTPLYLPVTMRGGCLGEPCDPNSTCVKRGSCTPAEIPNPTDCADPNGCPLPGEEAGGAGGAGSGGFGGTGGSGGTNAASSSGSGGSSTSASSSSSNSSSSNSSTGTGGFGGAGGMS